MQTNEDWLEEKHDDFLGMRYRIIKRLFSGKSEFQKVEVVETKGHGKMLLNDDLVMITERDEFIYHEMIAHVPLFVHPNAKRVLVIGGGDGGTVREVIRHKNVEICYLVEIDEMVVNACKEFIPQTSKDLADPRAKVIIDDGVKFMAETKEKFDLIIIDSTDPFGCATPLFGEEFYTNVHRVLNDDGIVVAQGESPFYEVKTQRSLMQIMNTMFPKCHYYNFNNLTYPGGMWSFTFGSKKYCPLGDFDANRVKASGLDFDYYNSDIHRAAFALPEFMRKNLDGLLTAFKG